MLVLTRKESKEGWGIHYEEFKRIRKEAERFN